ncbi:MAG: UDP-4-amino-4,6-dideoxy-N-acetyl-beta-L-altrosamine transaminase [Mycobacterium sp.]|nr:MAG: UDP-4-amino-4,6-dideoxy-N-acetyl-beta-L-altrosamine transaminase [Mycobacterium sp.]
MIPYGRQSIDEDDIAAVVTVMRSDFLTQGPAVEEFEASLRAATGARHAVAFANGTAALHAAVAVAGLGPGDVVATSPLSFAASANCARYVGADVRFVDIDPDTLNLDVSAVPDDVDALVAVHYAGLPVDLRRLGHRPRVLIEDAAHAIGALTPDGPVGNCAHSDMTCFSFHPVKTVTTGEGGAVTTNSDEFASALRQFRHHGIVKRVDDPYWRYDVTAVGYNYRLTDMQAALGTSQMRRLDQFVARRNEIADRYRREFSDDGRVGLPPAAPVGSRHAHHLFPIMVDDRDRVFDELRAAGIGVQLHYVPTYRFSSFAGTGEPADFPETERAFSRMISLPMFPALSDNEQATVIETVAAAVGDA